MHQIFQGHVQTEGFLADYALFGRGLMALSAATDDKIWRERAATFADGIIERFMAPDGALAMTAAETNFLTPMESAGDRVYPSGISAAIDLLLRLSAAGEDDRYAAAAGRILRYYSAQMDRYPESWATAVVAVNATEVQTAIASKANVADRPRQPGRASAGYRPPETADHVRVSGKIRDDEDGDAIIVTLTIDEGYHVNANPASLDYLIPTTLEFAGVAP